MLRLYNSQPCEVVHWEKHTQAAELKANPYPLEYGAFLLSDMEASDEELRKKHQVTKEDVEEALERKTGHDFYHAVGSLLTGTPFTAKQKHAQDYLKEKEEIEEQRKKSSVMWMKVFSPNDGFMHGVEVKLDSGADQNFITEDLVSRFRLRKKPLGQPQGFDSAQGTFICTSKVQLVWEGQDKEKNNTEFFVLPSTSPVAHPLVREDLIETFRSKLFIEKPTGSVAYVAQQKMTAEEKTQVQPLSEKVAADRAELARRKEAHEQKKRKSPRQDDKPGPSRSSKRTKK